VLSVVVVVGAIAAIPLLNPNPTNQDDGSITVTLLYNAGVMIETGDVRIYVDPFDLNSTYADMPADAILITHPHGDHYDTDVMDMLQKNDTVNIFPANMTDAISAYDGVAVNPMDQVQVGTINVTAYYMYTLPVGEWPASHPAEANWTSYIIDIDGFTIFHSGDSKTISQYEALKGQIDVACLAIGPGCQTMTGSEVIDALEDIEPRFFIPIHYSGDGHEDFMQLYFPTLDDSVDCAGVCLDWYTSRLFTLEEITG
jgi:L-ascorbate metabolism protein UlaG (beta-lactamase superfamily)